MTDVVVEGPILSFRLHLEDFALGDGFEVLGASDPKAPLPFQFLVGGMPVAKLIRIPEMQRK